PCQSIYTTYRHGALPIWIPLDYADAETGAMSFVRGSHRWDQLSRPNWFVSNRSMAGTVGDEVLDVEAMAAAGEVELLQFALGPRSEEHTSELQSREHHVC